MTKKYGASPLAVKNSSPLVFEYKNWRGEVRIRRVKPLMVWHGNTEFHPDPQWMLCAEDLDNPNGETRDFAIADIIRFIKEV